MNGYLYMFALKVLSHLNSFKDVVLKEQGILRGYKVDADNVYSYYGVPYATTPSGEDKFKDSLPPKSWNGVFEATEKGIACPQSKRYDEGVTIKPDCLIANIFVPDTAENNLPVLFYIHGGSFKEGHASELSGISLAAKGLIAVHINYRLGLQGFLCLGTEFAPGNAGPKDIVTALKWVKNNIASFGGDPDNITVGGSSAGGTAVELLMLSPLSNGLFTKASCESGAASGPGAVTKDPLNIAANFANFYGGDVNNSITNIEDFYKNLPDEALYYEFNELFLPCVETHNFEDVRKFLVERPMETLINSNYNKVTLLTGFTQFEGLEFQNNYDPSVIEQNITQFILENQSYTDEIDDGEKLEVVDKIINLYFSTGVTFEGYTDFFSDNIFIFPLFASALHHATNGAEVYMYYFTYNGSLNLPSSENQMIKGPGHIAESLYVFNYINKSLYSNMSEYDYVIQEELREMYADFVINGNPISNLPSLWVPVMPEQPYFLHIDKYFVLSEYPIKERLEIWIEMFGLNFL